MEPNLSLGHAPLQLSSVGHTPSLDSTAFLEHKTRASGAAVVPHLHAILHSPQVQSPGLDPGLVLERRTSTVLGLL